MQCQRFDWLSVQYEPYMYYALRALLAIYCKLLIPYMNPTQTRGIITVYRSFTESLLGPKGFWEC